MPVNGLPKIAAPLELRRITVPQEWIDYNGHMMDGYYAVTFSHTTDALMDLVGLDAAYREATHCTLYTAEMHVVYLRDLREGAPLRFTTQLLAFDSRRIHLFHALYHDAENYLAATCELMQLHVDQSQSRVVPMPESVTRRLARIIEAHAVLPQPAQAGRVIGLSTGRAQG